MAVEKRWSVHDSCGGVCSIWSTTVNLMMHCARSQDAGFYTLAVSVGLDRY